MRYVRSHGRARPAAALALALLLATVACGGGSGDGPTEPDPPTPPPPPPPDNAVATMTLTLPNPSLTVGGTATPQAAARNAAGQPVQATISWSSSDPDVATVAASGTVTAVSAGATTLTAASGGKTASATLQVDPRNLDALVEQIRVARGLPAMTGAIVSSKGLIGIGVAGTRRGAGGGAVTRDDRWHIGSNLKALTATLAAVAVSRGQIAWTTTVEQAFPELVATMHPQFRTVTLEDLLANRGGIRSEPPISAYAGSTARQQRESLSAWALTSPPIGARGSYYYSNPGFVIAGAMIERAMGGTYEELLATQLGQPVGVTSLGWGPTTPAGQSTNPVGHRWQNGAWVACEACDNPPGLSAAGRAHISMGDWARIIEEVLKADDGRSALMTQPNARLTFTAHTPIPGSADSYGLGWNTTTRPWGGRTVYHAGSNVSNHSIAWVGLDSDVAFLAATNAADLDGGTTAAALDALVSRLLTLHQTGN